MLTKNFQHELLLHDYGVSGYQLNHEDELQISAFSSLPNENDIECGREALASIGYDETTSMRFLPAVQTYRNQTVLSIFVLLVFLFGAIYYRCFSIFNANIRLSVMLKIPSVNFWTVILHPVSNVHKLATGTAFFMPSMKWRLSSLLTLRTRGRQKEFLQDIISDVSHQIKTPLSALKMYHEIIESHKNDAATVSSFTEKSQREIKRMEDVIYTLLKLARLDAGIIQMEKAEENVSILMQDVLERFETWAEREHKKITLSGKEDVILSCDALWVSEAIGNIIKNALEHTENGGHIGVKWSQSPLMTQIEISDDGKGIHPEDLYNIFKRFYRSRLSSDVHGIGLGLPLAKSIVEAHGGTISVTSTPGTGTTFTLNFINLTNE